MIALLFCHTRRKKRSNMQAKKLPRSTATAFYHYDGIFVQIRLTSESGLCHAGTAYRIGANCHAPRRSCVFIGARNRNFLSLAYRRGGSCARPGKRQRIAVPRTPKKTHKWIDIRTAKSDMEYHPVKNGFLPRQTLAGVGRSHPRPRAGTRPAPTMWKEEDAEKRASSL